MATGYLHLASGIAGDMLMGALVDAGAPLDVMEGAVQAVTGKDVHLIRHEVRRGGLRATKIDVRVGDTVIDETDPGFLDASAQAPPPHPHQAYVDIEARIQKATLSEFVSKHALQAFSILARSESAVHGVPLSKVHFHELGAIDAMADILGAVAGVEAMGLKRLIHGPVAVGGGTVQTAHGVLPVPAPATLAVLEGRTCVLEENRGELTTPTGAALLVALAKESPAHLRIRPQSTGYGAGSRDPKGRPNVVRILVGEEEAETTVRRAQVAVVEASLDDCTPEEGAHLLRDLLEAGALDATLTPTIMKKGRPGFLIRVIVSPQDGPRFAERVVSRSPSLGARWRVEDRVELDRRIDHLQLSDGTVRVKVAILPDGTERIHPEYEDLAALAGKRGISLAQLRVEVEQVWRSNR